METGNYWVSLPGLKEINMTSDSGGFITLCYYLLATLHQFIEVFRVSLVDIVFVVDSITVNSSDFLQQLFSDFQKVPGNVKKIHKICNF